MQAVLQETHHANPLLQHTHCLQAGHCRSDYCCCFLQEMLHADPFLPAHQLACCCTSYKVSCRTCSMQTLCCQHAMQDTAWASALLFPEGNASCRPLAASTPGVSCCCFFKEMLYANSLLSAGRAGQCRGHYCHCFLQEMLHANTLLPAHHAGHCRGNCCCCFPRPVIDKNTMQSFAESVGQLQ